MKIGAREIGPSQPPYLVAELGVNHNGSLERALELTRLAASAGADAIKLQLFEADRLMSKASRLAAYQKSAGETDPVAMLRRLELPLEQMSTVVSLAHELGLHAIVTVFSVELVAKAQALPWDAYKTASPDIINKPLLDELVRTGRPILVSTGASTLAEVGEGLSWVRQARERVALFQCVSSYPTPMALAELGGIGALRDIFDGPVGYSDHTPGVYTGAAAVASGATLLEKHTTYSRNATGPDHSASLEPGDLRQYRNAARLAHSYAQWNKGIGAGVGLEASAPGQRDELREAMRQVEQVERVKRVLAIEEDVRRVSRQSIVSTRALPAGHTLERGDLTIKRPGTGLAPKHLSASIGRKLARAVEADMPLEASDLA